MKNIILVITIILSISISTRAQQKYEAGMKKAFELWEEKKTDDALAMFERIAQAEKDKWQPLYHATNLLISNSFREEDNTIKNSTLEKAKELIAQAHERSVNNSELITLEGLLYTGYVAMDPGTYGMKFSQKIMELHHKAIEINPENPRAQCNKIEYEMGSARFFKQDLAPFCEKMKEIIPKFENQKSDELFAPKHGKDRAINIVENCGK